MNYVEENVNEIKATTTIKEKFTDILEKYIEIQEKSENYKKASEYYKILIQKQFDTNKTEGILKLNMAEARNHIKKKDEELELQKINSKN